MTFKKGDPRPEGAGRKKKIPFSEIAAKLEPTANLTPPKDVTPKDVTNDKPPEKKITTYYVTIADYLREKKIPLIQLWLQTIMEIKDPWCKAKAIEQVYKYVEAPAATRDQDYKEPPFGNQAAQMLIDMEKEIDFKSIISMSDLRKNEESS